MFKFVSLIPVPQIWVRFLHLLTLILHGSVQLETALWVREKEQQGLVKEHKALGESMASQSSLLMSCPKKMVGRLPNGVQKLFRRKNHRVVTSLALISSKAW